MSKQVIIQGVRYSSISRACKSHDIDQNVVYLRVNRLNWDLETAITTPVNSLTRPVILDGKLYKSLREVAQEYGVRHRTLICRLHNGWSLEDAITTPIRNKGSKGYKVYLRGVYYPSISKAAESYGINPENVYMRLRYGWSLEDAITTPVGNKRINSIK